MELSTGEKIEELCGRKPYEIEFEVDPRAVCHPGDYQNSDPNEFLFPPSHQIDHPATLYKTDGITPGSEEFFFSDKIELIKQAITETISEMKTRLTLNRVFIQRIDSKIADFVHELSELKHWTLGNNASIETRRIHLEKELLQLEKEKRINNLSCWKDLLWLKKDLREAVSEYKSLLRMKNILS